MCIATTSPQPAAGDDQQVEAGCVAREKMWMTVAITET